MKIENIKFKAKKLNSCEWVEGDLVHLGNRVCIGGNHLKDGITDVDPSTVCMFTGMKDEDGKEIWEHDILKNYPMENEVVFKNGSFMIIEDYGDEINEVPLSEMIYEDGICILEKIDSKFDRKEGGK